MLGRSRGWGACHHVQFAHRLLLASRPYSVVGKTNIANASHTPCEDISYRHVGSGLPRLS